MQSINALFEDKKVPLQLKNNRNLNKNYGQF